MDDRFEEDKEWLLRKYDDERLASIECLVKGQYGRPDPPVPEMEEGWDDNRAWELCFYCDLKYLCEERSQKKDVPFSDYLKSLREIKVSRKLPRRVILIHDSDVCVITQSVDSSTNIVNVESSALFDEIKKVILESINDELVRSRLVKEVEAMKSAVGTTSFSSRYKDFITMAADHMTLLAPFLPALSQLLL